MDYSLKDPVSLRGHLETIFKGSSAERETAAAQALAWRGEMADFEIILIRISNSEKTRNFSSTREKRALNVIISTMRKEGNPGFPLIQSLFKMADIAGNETWEFTKEKLVEMCTMPRAKERVMRIIQSREDRYVVYGDSRRHKIAARLQGLKSAIEVGEMLTGIPSQAERLRRVSTRPPRPFVESGKRVLAWLGKIPNK